MNFARHGLVLFRKFENDCDSSLKSLSFLNLDVFLEVHNLTVSIDNKIAARVGCFSICFAAVHRIIHLSLQVDETTNYGDNLILNSFVFFPERSSLLSGP